MPDSSDASARPLGVLTEEFGAYSTEFVRRQLSALEELRPFVACWLRSNETVFQQDAVHVLSQAAGTRRFWASLAGIFPRRYRLRDRIIANSALKRLLDRYRPRVLHIHFGWAAVRVLQTLERTRIPFTLVLHGSDLNTAHKSRNSPYARQLVRAMQLARLCLFVSEDLREKGVELGCPEERAKVFYLGVPCPSEAEPLAGDGTPRIVTNGRLIEWKGHSVLIEALAMLKKRGKHALLTLIGEGPLRTELEEKALELGVDVRVRFLDRLPNRAIYDELLRSHIYAHPSRRLPGGEEEGLGLAVQEAMAVGLPVVATATGGIPESVINGETGLLVEHSDPAAMAEALGRLIDDAELRARMGAAGRERIRVHFNLELQNRKLKDLLVDLAGGAP